MPPRLLEEPRLALTPAGVLYAYAQAAPAPNQALLQAVLAAPELPTLQDWLRRGAEHKAVLGLGLAQCWLHTVLRRPQAPDVRLDDFLPHVIGGLSGERKAALSASGGFCVGHTGYDSDEAEALCVAAADFSEFAQRQRTRGWAGASHMASFHDDAAMLIPTVSFVPFWVDGIDFCLVLGGEPLINNPAFVELVWGIQASGRRFSNPAAPAPA